MKGISQLESRTATAAVSRSGNYRKRAWALGLGLVLGSGVGWGQALLYEPFDYPNGDPIVGANGGTGFSAAWAQESVFPSGNLFYSIAGSLTYTDVPTEGGNLTFYGGNVPSTWFEKVERPFASSLTAGTFTFYYLWQVTDFSALEYADLQLVGSTNNLRLHLQNLIPGDDPTRLLLDGNDTGLNLSTGVNLIYGQVTLGAGNDPVSLWLNPVLASLGSPDFTLSSIDFGDLIALELTGFASDGLIIYDAITVIPEPGTWMLLVMGGGLLALCRWRYRRVN